MSENMNEKKNPVRLLAIDKALTNLELISKALDQQGIEVLTASDLVTGFELFIGTRPQIVLLDLTMPEMDGMALLERMVAADPGVDVILMSENYSAESAVAAIQKGACDFVAKPVDIEKLRRRISSLLEDAAHRRKALELDRALVDAFQFEGMIGRSPLVLGTFARIRRVAPHF